MQMTSKYLSEDQVLVDVEARDKWDLLDRMITALARHPLLTKETGVTESQIRKAILAREKQGSTGLADGFAFPHARLPKFNAIGMCVALPKSPIGFESLDGQPARFVCLAIVPQERPTLALKLMSQLAAMVSDTVSSAFLTSVKDPKALHLFIARTLEVIGAPVTAKDIMRKPFADVRPDTPLKQVTRIMSQHVCDAIEIVSGDGTLVGEITCDLLFKVGIPDFFGQLKSVAFIRGFDPFEKYFEDEARALAKDVMSTSFSAVPPTATLLEIVFELAIRGRHKVYVVEEGKRIGVVDRIAVLDRVLNF